MMSEPKLGLSALLTLFNMECAKNGEFEAAFKPIVLSKQLDVFNCASIITF